MKIIVHGGKWNCYGNLNIGWRWTIEQYLLSQLEIVGWLNTFSWQPASFVLPQQILYVANADIVYWFTCWLPWQGHFSLCTHRYREISANFTLIIILIIFFIFFVIFVESKVFPNLGHNNQGNWGISTYPMPLIV